MMFRVQETKFVLPQPPVRCFFADHSLEPPLQVLKRHYDGGLALAHFTDQKLLDYLSSVLAHPAHTELRIRDWLDGGVSEMNALFVSRKGGNATLEVYRGIYHLREFDPFKLQTDVDVRGHVASMTFARIKVFEADFVMKPQGDVTLFEAANGEKLRELITRYRQWSNACDAVNQQFIQELSNPN